MRVCMKLCVILFVNMFIWKFFVWIARPRLPCLCSASGAHRQFTSRYIAHPALHIICSTPCHNFSVAFNLNAIFNLDDVPTCPTRVNFVEIKFPLSLRSSFVVPAVFAPVCNRYTSNASRNRNGILYYECLKEKETKTPTKTHKNAGIVKFEFSQ